MESEKKRREEGWGVSYCFHKPTVYYKPWKPKKSMGNLNNVEHLHFTSILLITKAKIKITIISERMIKRTLIIPMEWFMKVTITFSITSVIEKYCFIRCQIRCQVGVKIVIVISR